MKNNKMYIDSYDENNYQEGLSIVPAKKLEDGWNWYKYDDGSGHLEGPDGTQYMNYDLSTNEYKLMQNLKWEFFPLDYYYIDGIKSSQFNVFDFMEQEMLNRILDSNNA